MCIYVVVFNAEDLPDGIYACLLEVDGLLLKRTMIRLDK